MSGFEPGPGWREVQPEPSREQRLALITEGHIDRMWTRDEPVPPLPTEPGTVIRTGPFWWLNCETYTRPDGTPGNKNAWLLLPYRSEVALRAMSASHLEPQAIYDRARVLEQVDEYGFEVLAEPRAVTAEAVVERVRHWTGQLGMSGALLEVVAREFGVES